MVKKALTANEGLTNATSGNAVLDLFSVIGTRSKDFTHLFSKAMDKDPQLAMRVMMWARDIRGGAGERDTTKTLLKYIEQKHPEELNRLIPAWPDFGRWDDLFVFETPKAKDIVHSAIRKALIVDKNGICAKWMPRQGEKAAEIRKALGMSPKQWRKTLVNMTTVVESLMCEKRWSDINYSHVPSVASSRYQRAFGRNDSVRYGDYLNALKTKSDPKVKINASAIFPMDVLKGRAKDAVIAQWDALPNYLGDNKILPMIDVSGSMQGLPMDVALSTGLYIADKQQGIFHDIVMTFATDSKIYKLKGEDILEKRESLLNSDHAWGTTNFHKAFENLLLFAKQNKIKEDDMPKYIVAISDMEFNSATGQYGKQVTSYDNARFQFKQFGYTLPKIVFWNVNGRAGNSPVTINDDGTALVSGYSPTVLKSILSDKLDNFSPLSIMMDTIMAERYNIW